MNKTEFVDAVAQNADVPKKTAAKVIDSVVTTVVDVLKDGDQVTLIGFGTFLLRRRDARKGRNPRTGDTIQIAASNVPSFKAGKALKDAVN